MRFVKTHSDGFLGRFATSKSCRATKKAVNKDGRLKLQADITTRRG